MSATDARQRVTPASRYVMIKRFSEMTGYSDHAVRMKISEGVWVEGIHYKRAPDRHVFIDMEGFEKWVEGQKSVTQASSRARRA
mgnify:CR=1 FL=1